MNRLLALALVLTVAGCGTAGGSVARPIYVEQDGVGAPVRLTVTDTGTLVIGTPAPVTIGPFPLDGAFVYQADTRCGAAATVLPNLATMICMRTQATQYLINEIAWKRFTPGFNFTACDWAYPNQPQWQRCVGDYLSARLPEIRLGVTPAWVSGSIGGQPFDGCASGVAYPTYIRVSIADLPRSYRLVGWETVNTFLAYTLDRYTAADGPIVAAATNAAALACGVS